MSDTGLTEDRFKISHDRYAKGRYTASTEGVKKNVPKKYLQLRLLQVRALTEVTGEDSDNDFEHSEVV